MQSVPEKSQQHPIAGIEHREYFMPAISTEPSTRPVTIVPDHVQDKSFHVAALNGCRAEENN
jgi:hypothetical protein